MKDIFYYEYRSLSDIQTVIRFSPLNDKCGRFFSCRKTGDPPFYQGQEEILDCKDYIQEGHYITVDRDREFYGSDGIIFCLSNLRKDNCPIYSEAISREGSFELDWTIYEEKTGTSVSYSFYLDGSYKRYDSENEEEIGKYERKGDVVLLSSQNPDYPSTYQFRYFFIICNRLMKADAYINGGIYGITTRKVFNICFPEVLIPKQNKDILNALSAIVSKYERIWENRRRFSALLNDYLPQDRQLRNLLLISSEEGIPTKLLSCNDVDELLVCNLANTLSSASGCGRSKSYEIIELWINILKNMHTNSGDLSDECSELYQYSEEDDGICIEKYLGNSNRIIIPETVDGKDVTSISGTKPYRTGVDDWIEIVLPNTLKRIEEAAFYSDCIKGISLPDGLEYIGRIAFSWSAIDHIIIPASVKRIEEAAFSLCKNLYIEVDPDNPNYTSENGALYDKNKETLLFYPYRQSTISIPSTVKRIGSAVFENADFGNDTDIYIIPEHIEEIGESSFDGVINTVITVPKTLSSIGKYSFSDSKVSLDLESFLQGLSEVPLTAFQYTEFVPQIKELKIPENTFYEGNPFFESNIEKIVFPASHRTVDVENCSKFRVIVFEEGVEQLCGGDSRNKSLSDYDFEDMEIHFPMSINTIEASFINCRLFCPKGSYAETFFTSIRENDTCRIDNEIIIV